MAAAPLPPPPLLAPRTPSETELALCAAVEAGRCGLKAAQARLKAAQARLKADQARFEEERARLEAEQAHLEAERVRLEAESARLVCSGAAATSACGGAEAAYTRRGERFLDVIGLIAARGYAAEVSQCRALCGLTWRRGDLGATNDMIASSLRLQCGAAQAHEARRERFTFAAPWGGLRTLDGTTQLIRASILNNLPRVLQLIQLGAPLDLIDQSDTRWSELPWASFLGHEHVVAALLEGKYKGADVEQVCSGSTALEAASTRGHVAVMRVLLARGAKQVRPGQTYTSMHRAVYHNRIEVVKLLLAAPGASYALNSKHDGRTLLKHAIDDGHAEIEELLRTAGAAGE